ncbi:sulfite exporter TauE/SafE family protein [Novosphingobium sp.]|uniref:sulfite exporter TauE/SafE family protein n=1 Tax=Novosphingobium sp. TaxID=1874826 RepID=UPI002616A147|nr:sulfite exporter TauE/SafE family protein [Novosphingobium sp.]
MVLAPFQYLLGGASGLLVGFTLGLVGGGGSILAVPLMVYLVGVTSPHLAIGTSALAVAVNAAGNLVPHARQGTIKWRCAGMYALAGVAGAFAGSTLGKAFDGQKLLFLFALLMLVVGVLMLRGRGEPGNPDVQCQRENAPKVIAYGSATGLFSGFFGIGGGFLIVPGLMASTGMPMINAVGSSLVAVAAFGLTTAINYAVSGFIDWGLAAAFIGGGMLGGVVGAAASRRLSAHKGLLNSVFAALIFCVAFYMLWKSWTAA